MGTRNTPITSSANDHDSHGTIDTTPTTESSSPPTVKPWNSINHVAQLLDLEPQTIRKFVANGELKATRFGRRIKISQAQLDEFISSRPGGPL